VGSIIGRVLGPGGVPFAGRVQVELYLRGAPIKSTYSDESGNFAFYELNYNPYRVVINEKGYQSASELVVVRPDISPVTSVRLTLIALEKESPEKPSGPAEAANPYLVDLATYSKQFPRQAVKEFEAGIKAEQEGNPKKAREHYQEAIRLAPEFYPAHNNLGSSYLSQGNYQAAEQAFSKVIELNHADPQAYLNLGNVFFVTGRYEEAERTLQEGLQRDPRSAFGHFLLGSVYVRRGDAKNAERYLQRAVELDATMPNPRLELVNLYLQQNRAEEAISVLNAFIELFPQHPMAPKAKELLQKLEGASPTP
jgi:tetratricopeptide (TPR) repeat protein